MITNAIDVAAFSYDEQARHELRAELGIDSRFVVGHVGRLYENKNHSFLLEVFGAVRAARSDATLVLVGDGPLRGHLEATAERLGLRDAVVFAGSRCDVNRIYSAMDVFVFPSHHEGFGIAPLEAQANGLPVVMADTIPEQVHIGAASVRLPLSETLSTWADHVLSARRDPSVNGRVRSAGFDVRATTDLLTKHYTAMLSSEAPGTTAPGRVGGGTETK